MYSCVGWNISPHCILLQEVVWKLLLWCHPSWGRNSFCISQKLQVSASSVVMEKISWNTDMKTEHLCDEPVSIPGTSVHQTNNDNEKLKRSFLSDRKPTYVNGEKIIWHLNAVEYLCLVVKFRATTSRQFNRLMCSIPRKSTEGRQNCEYVGKTNRSCLCHCPESTDSEDQTCTGTTQSMQTDYQLRPETTLQGQLGSIWVQLTQLQPSILKLGHCLIAVSFQ